jgi:hypothetical protein
LDELKEMLLMQEHHGANSAGAVLQIGRHEYDFTIRYRARAARGRVSDITLPNSAVAFFAALVAWGQFNPFPLSSLKVHNVKVEQAMYNGKQAVRITEAAQK